MAMSQLILAHRMGEVEGAHTPQVVRDTVMQLEMDLFAPIRDIRIIDAFYEHGPGVSMVGGGAFRLGVRLRVEGSGY